MNFIVSFLLTLIYLATALLALYYGLVMEVYRFAAVGIVMILFLAAGLCLRGEHL